MFFLPYEDWFNYSFSLDTKVKADEKTMLTARQMRSEH